MNDKYPIVKKNSFVKFRKEAFPINIFFPSISYEDYQVEVIESYLVNDVWGYHTDPSVTGGFKKKGYMDISFNLKCEERYRAQGDSGHQRRSYEEYISMTIDNYGIIGKIIKSLLYQDAYNYINRSSDLPFQSSPVIKIDYDLIQSYTFQIECILCEYNPGKSNKRKFTNSSVQGIRVIRMHRHTIWLTIIDDNGYMNHLPAALFDII